MDQLIGYAYLIEKYGLKVMPHHCQSVIGSDRVRTIDTQSIPWIQRFPSTYQPAWTWEAQLEFAFKYEGIHLGVLAQLFQKISKVEIEQYIQEKPYAQQRRRLWFLYEFLNEESLNIPALTKGNYIELLNPKHYYTTPPQAPTPISKRCRVHHNLLGTALFCPMIRKTKNLHAFENQRLEQDHHRLLEPYSKSVIQRASSYLYTKETKSSFKIEHIEPSFQKKQQFVRLLQQDFHQLPMNEAFLVQLQKSIVDERFASNQIRNFQNYVGQTLRHGEEYIHFIPPTPEDLPSLIQGWFQTIDQLASSSTHPVIQAACLSFAFVLFHPFEDGNGRLHRFLIHYFLIRLHFLPPHLIFPVSASILSHQKDYDAALEQFSIPLMQQLKYDLDSQGNLKVLERSDWHYRYPDMTHFAEKLFEWIQQTLENDWKTELEFIERYDVVKPLMQEIVDLPDRQLDQFLMFCLNNEGTLSKTKKKRFFDKLSESEVAQLEQIIQRHWSFS